MKIDLVIFDCDGVLVDSEPISNSIFCNMLQEISIDINTEKTERLFKGKSIKDCCNIVENKFNKTLSEKFIQDFRKRTFTAFKERLRPIPGVDKALQAIDYPLCVASSGPLRKIRLNLAITKLDKYFNDNIFSATQLEKGKPAPDIFLHAAQKMNANPANSLVIEDSEPGLNAGLAAKMQVLFYSKSAKNLSYDKFENVIYFTDMKLLPDIIENLNEN